uniref:Uncharacterized protein n=1 Tax=viral metagenome TaxID=1070528 RepID=A0A6C0F2K2_9ZZZZ
MASNPFKVQYKRSGENNMQRSNQTRGNNSTDAQNRFRGKNAKPIFSLSDADFPEMIAPQSAVSNPNASLDYKAATFIKDAEPKEQVANQEYIPPGHVLIYMDENRNIVQKYGDKNPMGYYMHNYNDEENLEPSYVFQKLANSWLLRKQKYDELYGEGEYDRVYGMPHVDNDCEYSDEEEENYDVNDYYDY